MFIYTSINTNLIFNFFKLGDVCKAGDNSGAHAIRPSVRSFVRRRYQKYPKSKEFPNKINRFKQKYTTFLIYTLECGQDQLTN